MTKGIALSTVAYLILAMITIVLILIIINSKISPSMKNIFCSVFQGLRSILPLPTDLKPEIPLYCQKDVPVYIETTEIESRDPDRIAFTIASYIIACWEKTGKINVGQNQICYEVTVRGVNGEVDDTMVKNSISSSNVNPDILTWKLGKINKSKTIGIAYNSTSKTIEAS